MRRTQLSILRQAQAGQALLEWVVVMALALMAAVWAAGQWVQDLERAAAQGHAHWLQAVAISISQAIESSHPDPQAWRTLQDRLHAKPRHPVEEWLPWLTEQGWLAAALSKRPHMPYEVTLAAVDQTEGCRIKPCPLAVLLLAQPNRQGPSDPSDLLSALSGQGLSVSMLAPDRLQGPAYRLANPPLPGPALPVGTVGLLVWRSDRLAPYVRLKEDRLVQFDGGVKLGALATSGAPCAPDGMVSQGANQELLICRQGRWQSVALWEDRYAACLPENPGDPVARGIMAVMGFDTWLTATPCDCQAGFRAVEMGREIKRFGRVELRDGYLCESL